MHLWDISGLGGNAVRRASLMSVKKWNVDKEQRQRERDAIGVHRNAQAKPVLR